VVYRREGHFYAPREMLRAVDLEEMREWFRERCEETSVREIARRSDMQHNTIHKFVTDGVKPHERIRLQLAQYYLIATGAYVPPEGPGIDARRDALDALLDGLSEEATRRTARRVLDVVEEGYGDNVPEWVAKLRSEIPKY
jgi:hypothetical protein